MIKQIESESCWCDHPRINHYMWGCQVCFDMYLMGWFSQEDFAHMYTIDNLKFMERKYAIKQIEKR